MTRPKVTKAEHIHVLEIHKRIVYLSEKMLKHYEGKEILSKGCIFCSRSCIRCPWMIYEGISCISFSSAYFGFSLKTIEAARNNTLSDRDLQEKWNTTRIKQLKQWISKSKKQIKYREKKIGMVDS